MTTCPVCNKPVDPLRARAVGVRDGKIVAYCSAECAAAGEAAPKTQAVFDSGPVIEVIRDPGTPPTGTVKKGTPPVGTPVRKNTPPAGTPVKKTPPTGTAVASAAPPSSPADKPASVAKQASPTTASAKPTSDPMRGSPPIGVPIAVVSRGATPALGVKPATGTVVGDHKREPTGPVKRPRRDSLDVRQAPDWSDDDEPAVPVRPPTAPPVPLDDEPLSTSRRGLWLVLVLLIAAGGFALYRFVIAPPAKAPQGAGSAGSGSPAAQAPVAIDAAAPAASPIERATTTLRHHLTAERSTPKIRRLAAMALSRANDRDAIAWLTGALDKPDLSSADRIELANALARAGDPRGSGELYKLLASARDDRLTAAQKLARLGDKKAIPHLAAYLDNDRTRLSAATELARFADPQAIKTLEAIRADPTASADAHSSAAIGLVLAGKRELADEVAKLLTTTSFNHGAAEALASIGDERARAALEQQLASEWTAADAATTLVRFTNQPPARYLDSLVAMLGRSELRDLNQITISEAIVVLAMAGRTPTGSK